MYRFRRDVDLFCDLTKKLRLMAGRSIQGEVPLEVCCSVVERAGVDLGGAERASTRLCTQQQLSFY